MNFLLTSFASSSLMSVYRHHRRTAWHGRRGRSISCVVGCRPKIWVSWCVFSFNMLPSSPFKLSHCMPLLSALSSFQFGELLAQQKEHFTKFGHIALRLQFIYIYFCFFFSSSIRVSFSENKKKSKWDEWNLIKFRLSSCYSSYSSL